MEPDLDLNVGETVRSSWQRGRPQDPCFRMLLCYLIGLKGGSAPLTAHRHLVTRRQGHTPAAPARDQNARDRCGLPALLGSRTRPWDFTEEDLGRLPGLSKHSLGQNPMRLLESRFRLLFKAASSLSRSAAGMMCPTKWKPCRYPA